MPYRHIGAPVARLSLALGLALLAATGLLILGWGSPGAFAAAVDRPAAWFADFVAHYWPTASAFAHGNGPTDGYFYTAFFAALLLPLAALSQPVAVQVWMGLEIVSALALLLVPALRLAKLRGSWAFLYGLLLLASPPLWHNLRWGQVSVLLIALCLVAVVLVERGQLCRGATVLAVAASIKLYPAALALLFAKSREGLTRFATATVSLAVALPLLLVGPEQWLAFHSRVREMARTALGSWVPYDVNSQYLPHVAARYARQLALPTAEVAALIVAVKVLGALLFTAICLHLLTSRRFRGTPRPAEMAAWLFTALPLVVATSWPHYFVYLPFCQVEVLRLALAAKRGAFRVICLALAALSAVAGSSLAFWALGGHPRYAASGCLLGADLALLAALAILPPEPSAPSPLSA